MNKKGAIIMDAQVITTLITSVGFPIVACLGMFWYLTKVMEKRDQKMDETLNKMSEVVNENNKLIALFTEKLDILFKISQKGGEDDGR